MLRFSMLTCAQQIDTKIFAYMKHIRPRRALIIDEQKGLVATFPLFVHDGTSRTAKPDAPPGMLQNLVTMETFGNPRRPDPSRRSIPLCYATLRAGQRLDHRLRPLIPYQGSSIDGRSRAQFAAKPVRVIRLLLPFLRIRRADAAQLCSCGLCRENS